MARGYHHSHKRHRGRTLNQVGNSVRKNASQRLSSVDREIKISVVKIGAPKGVNEIRSFFGSVQYLAKFIENLSAKTEPLRKLLKKDEKWSWGAEQQTAFEKLKEHIANITMLKHYDPAAQTILTTDASTKALAATLWQIDESGRRAVASASRFLCRAEKRYAINELELLAPKWAVEHFKIYILGGSSESKPIARHSCQCLEGTAITKSAAPD